MNEANPVPPVAGFKDRSTGLLVFCILLIILGAMVALAIPFMLLGQFVAATQMPNAQPTPMQFIWPAILMYLGLAVGFIWLGIGAIKCRRWARALALILGWMWLICGIVGVISVTAIMPSVFAHPPPGQPPMPPAVITVVTLIMVAVCSVFYIVLPGALVFFFRSPHVKATCEARDPVPRWTDACPLPVLAISLLLGFGVAFMPLLILFYHSIVPCFGVYVSGLPGAAVVLVSALVFAWAARATYKLQLAGWWTALLVYTLWIVSATITMARLGLLPMYEIMGFPKEQLDLLKQMDFLNHPLIWILMLVTWLPFLGFIVYTKKYFRQGREG
jgi:hypothetical protein